MKKLLAFLLPLALTLSLTACAPRDEREDENAHDKHGRHGEAQGQRTPVKPATAQQAAVRRYALRAIVAISGIRRTDGEPAWCR